MTMNGILGKSSNVGTLKIAQRLGPDRFAQMLSSLGVGSRIPGHDVVAVGQEERRPPAPDHAGADAGDHRCSPKIARAWSGVATVEPRPSTMPTARSTSAALVAFTPRAR